MLVPDQVTALRDGRIDLTLLRPPLDERDLLFRVPRRERLIVALLDPGPAGP